MNKVISSLVVNAMLVSTIGCTSATSPSPTPSGQTTITFNGLSVDGATVNVYSENGYSISASAGWLAKTGFGSPPPFIEFVTPAAQTGIGSFQVVANLHVPFSFRSIDLYSSITPIPYTISGVRDDNVVFTTSDVVPNTFGAFKTVRNPRADVFVDTLTIQLTNPSTCCPNPMGVDNIVLSR